jgi:hypothetical protein
MFVAVLILVLLSLWLFVRWHGNRPDQVKPLSRAVMQRGFRPGQTLDWREWSGMAITALAMAAGFAASPGDPPFTGRGSVLRSLLHELFGSYALTWICLAAGLVLASLALHAFATRSRD